MRKINHISNHWEIIMKSQCWICLLVITLVFGNSFSLKGANYSPLRRTFDLDFNRGPMKSRQLPQTEKANGKESPNEAMVLRPEFAEGIDGQALRSREPTDGLILDLSSNGDPIFPLVNGSIRFWFKPDWNSGEGPEGYGSLMSFGKWNVAPKMKGYWGLSFNPKGDRIQFGAQSLTEGKTFIATSVSFKKDNWYEIVLTYDVNETWIYVDGKPHGPGQGISLIPPQSALEDTGLALGNNPQGHQPVKGLIDGFEIFNFPLSEVEHQFKHFSMSAQVSQDPLSIQLQWPTVKKRHYQVNRRLSPHDQWKPLVTDLNEYELIDASPDLQPGYVYQYQITPLKPRGLVQQIDVAAYTPPNHLPGKVLLLVDQTHWNALGKELEQFREDLLLEGWEVVMEKAPRHVDSRWKSNVKRISKVKDLIQKHLGVPVDGMKMAILIGHVAVPYSGFIALDGHARPGDDHRGAWSCDAYYADIDGVWHDGKVEHINRTHPPASNVPGDGKFDNDQLPTRLEVAIGRIDFANLPSLNKGVLQNRSVRRSKMEVELIRQYLAKNHAYRFGSLMFESEAVIKSHLPRNMNHRFNMYSILNTSRWYGHIPGRIRTGDGFQDDRRSLWAFMAGRSGSASFASGVRRTRDFNQPEKGPRSAFLMLYSSWHGDWNVQDSFLRACLASPDGGVAAMSDIVGPWNLQSLGRGECLGFAFLESANQRPKRASRALAIMGDPTLGNYFTSPVSNLKMGVSDTPRQLNWNLPKLDEIEGVYLYKFDHNQNKFSLVDRLGINASQWALPDDIARGQKVMVRVAQWVHSASGVFAHLSPGKMIEVN